MRPRKRKLHVATGVDSHEIRLFCTQSQGVDEGDVVFHLAQCLAFLIQGSDATSLFKHAKVPRNKFAIRKLRSTLRMMDEVFETAEETEC
jgi:hypothetical protein